MFVTLEILQELLDLLKKGVNDIDDQLSHNDMNFYSIKLGVLREHLKELVRYAEINSQVQ